LAAIACSIVFLQILLSLNWAEERFQPDDAQTARIAVLQASFQGIDQVGAHYASGSTISSMVIVMLILLAVAFSKPKYWRLSLVGIAVAGFYSAERAASVIHISDVPDTMEASFVGLPVIPGAQVTDPTQVPFVAAGLGAAIAIMAILAAAQPPARNDRPAPIPQHS
jgi:hypothetical protein